MTSSLEHDRIALNGLLAETLNEAQQFFATLVARPVVQRVPRLSVHALPDVGMGAHAALAVFKNSYAAYVTGSVGPRYLGFVTGGSTPAALMGDWLTSVFDQNAADRSGVAAQIEIDAIQMLRALFGLPDDLAGAFVSGATLANFVGLALARQWLGKLHGVNAAVDGIGGMPQPVIFSGTPHSCIYKALAMLGIGRGSVRPIPTLAGREAIDISALRAALAARGDTPSVVVANAGVVNTVDFDDIAAIVALKNEYPFWLHVDAAFGGFAACSPRYKHLLAGWEHADSIAVDAHKWLNVPYDSAMQFSRHLDLQVEVFQNAAAAYLGPPNSADVMHLTPENSRRMRALPAWFTLQAYGAEGYRQIVEGCCDLAGELGARIANSARYRLLSEVRMNVVCFTLREAVVTDQTIQSIFMRLQAGGDVFVTPTVYQGTPALRAAFSNWRTQPEDVEIVWRALESAAHEVISV